MDLYRLARKTPAVTPDELKELKETLINSQSGPGIMIPDDIQKAIIEHPEDVLVWKWTEHGLIFQMRGDIFPYLFPIVIQ